MVAKRIPELGDAGTLTDDLKLVLDVEGAPEAVRASLATFRAWVSAQVDQELSASLLASVTGLEPGASTSIVPNSPQGLIIVFDRDTPGRLAIFQYQVGEGAFIQAITMSGVTGGSDEWNPVVGAPPVTTDQIGVGVSIDGTITFSNGFAAPINLVVTPGRAAILGSLTIADLGQVPLLAPTPASTVVMEDQGQALRMPVADFAAYVGVTLTPGMIGAALADPAAAVDWTQGATGAIADAATEVLRDSVSVMRFIPVALRPAIRARTSTTDLSTYLQAAVDYACTNSIELFWPRGRYSYATGLTATLGRLRMRGQGYLASTLLYTGAGVALQVSPPVGGDNSYYGLADLEITPSAAGGGTAGLVFTLASGAFLRNYNISRVLVGQFGGYGLTLDNTAANQDGFFTGVIERCYITNGINGIKVGDSNEIRLNTISCLDAYVGITLTSIGSLARQTNIIGNNITGRTGALYLKGMAGATVERNQLEHSTGAGDYNGSLSGHVVLEDCQYCDVIRNTISPGNPTTKATNAVRILGASSIGVNVESNQIAKGQTNHYAVEAGKHHHIGHNRWVDPTASLIDAVGTDAGTGTKGIWVPLGSLLVNSWVDDGSTNPPVACRKSKEGMVELRGSVSSGSGTVLTLPVGFRPAYTDTWYVSRALTTTGAEVSVAAAGGVTVPAAGSPTNIRLNQVRYQASAEL